MSSSRAPARQTAAGWPHPSGRRAPWAWPSSSAGRQGAAVAAVAAAAGGSGGRLRYGPCKRQYAPSCPWAAWLASSRAGERTANNSRRPPSRFMQPPCWAFHLACRPISSPILTQPPDVQHGAGPQQVAGGAGAPSAHRDLFSPAPRRTRGAAQHRRPSKARRGRARGPA